MKWTGEEIKKRKKGLIKMPLFFSLDSPLEDPGQKKRHFVACRMEQDLFILLSQKAQAQGSDLSSVIRQLCREGLR